MSTGLSYLTGILLLLIAVKGNHAAIAERSYYQTEVTEVTYKLKIGELHSKQISESGDSLVIGTNPVDEIGTSTTSVLCTRHMNVNDYKDEYRIEILKRTSNASEMTDSESKPKKIADLEYFVYIKKDLWSCTSGPQLSFLRVVNHLLGVKEIQGIKYHDGIEVSTKHYLGGTQKTAKIREVKYFRKNSTGTYAVRYLGKLKESPRENADHGIPDLSDCLYQNLESYDRDDMFREMDFRQIDEITVLPVTNTGINLILKYTYQKTTLDTFGNSDTQAVCVQDQGIHPLPKQYQLDFVQVVKRLDKLFEAEILPENKAEYFIPVVQEIWFCETIEKKLFIRVVNEVIGRKAVSKVLIHEGVTDLYAIRMHDNRPTIRLREVRYFDAITNIEIKYSGQVKLDTKAIIPPPENKKEITYALSDNRLFKILISSKGYDIRVGERWERKIDVLTQDIVCSLDPIASSSSAYSIKFRMKVHSVDKIKRTTYRLETLGKNKQKQFITSAAPQVSVCSDSGSRTKKFLRVFNEIRVLVPVHEVEFHDGIFVFDETLDKNSKSVQIVEIKYLDLYSKKVIKYEGKVTLKPTKITDSLPPFLKDASAAIKVTSDDIFWKVGHFSNLNLDLVNLTSYIENHPAYSGSMLYKEGGKYVMQFGAALSNTLGNKTDTAECKMADDTFFLSSLLLNNVTNKSVKQITKEDKSTYYHMIKKQNTWICQLPNVGQSFYLVDDDHILNNVLPSNYQDEICYFKWNQDRFSSVNFIMIDDNSYLDIKMTNYLQELVDENFTFSSFEGHVLFDGGREMARKSGTMPFEKKEKISMRLRFLTQETNYRVGRDWFYTSQLYRKGDSLHIGLKWTKVFGNSSSVFDCKKVDDLDGGMFDSFFRTRIRKAPNPKDNSNEKKKHNQQLFEEYFEPIKHEVWQCDNGEQRMLRVLNHFYIKRDMCNKVKEMFYHDGVTILLGTNHVQSYTEIVEIKYLDPKDYTVLKFEGKVQLKGKENNALLNNEITAKHRLKRVAKLEVHYLPKGEVHKTSVSEKGLVLEIGVANQETVSVRQLVCTEEKGYMPIHKDKYRPVILINKHTSSKIEQEIMSTDDIHECFTFTSSMWDCKTFDEEQKTFTRVVNELTAKEDCNKIATIFHYDGVVIDTHPVLTIREIKFYKDAEKTKTVRVLGFVHLEGPETTEQASPAITATREIYYKLGTRRLLVKQIDKVGPIIEVGSEFKNTFGTIDDAVLCRRIKDHSYDVKYKTQFFSNLKGKDDVNCPLELDDTTAKQYFQILKQELWKCSKNMNNAFLRVVNVYLALKDISRIFYPDGVSIGSQIFPDNQKAVQIKEVKYLEPGSLLPLKYEGKVTLVAISDVEAETLFQMPSKFEGYETALLEASRVNAEAVKYWPLDVLRVFALRKEPTNQILQGITYQTQQAAGLQQRTTTVIEGAHGIKVEVGSKYEAVLKTEGEMKCMLDEWNPTNEKKFLTKIKLHFDDEFYELDKDTILEYFDINSIEVWICVNNDDTMLRVVTTLTGIKEIYMVISHDGVEFNSITLPNNGKSIKITEYKYLDARDFKVLKYDGELKMIKRLEKAVAGSTGAATRQPTLITQPTRFNVLTSLSKKLSTFKFPGW